MNVIPLGENVLVRPDDPEEKSRGGVILPDSAKEKPRSGKVLAVGPGTLDKDGNRVPLEVQPGDRVLFEKYAGNKVQVDQEELLIVPEKGILGKLTGGGVGA